MRKLFLLVFCMLTCGIMFSCRTLPSDISYTVMDHYFQSNKVDKLPSATVTTAEEFHQLFGMAPVMGEHGMPTPVDFDKEYVIAVSKPATDVETELLPMSLKHDADGNVVFTYKVKTGRKLSYTLVPCLLIKVSKDIKGNVILNEQ